METMSVTSGCGCIRRYISFLILLIPIYIHSCIYSFLQQHPYFFKLFFVLVYVIFAIL